MKELSLHIMDLAENGIAAQGNLIRIRVNEDIKANQLTIEISDNGKGIPKAMMSLITDPFVTSRTTRRVGMGLSLFKAAAERCGGVFELESEPGQGTRVKGSFIHDHIDRAPVGDMATSLVSLLAGYPEIDIDYTHMYDGRNFEFDTREIRVELDGVPLNEPAVLQHLKHAIKEELDHIKESYKERPDM
ncbi:MAG: ATP-binding protein [Proteobacteria bacterium]|nr:ATP-binding protein [Pseudomonadota bacterium]